jgi:hypothetical protein
VSSDDRVGQFADARDRNPHHVSRSEEALRTEPDADAGRRSDGDQVAGLQGDAGANGFDDGADVENHIAQAGELAALTVDIGHELLRREVVEIVRHQATGEPTLVQNIDARTNHLRTFAIDPSGRLLVAASIQPIAVRGENGVGTLTAGRIVYGIGDDGKLTFVRKYEVDTGKVLQFWSGMVTLAWGSSPGQRSATILCGRRQVTLARRRRWMASD